MSDFNISSWKKNQYLDQAGLLSEATLPNPSLFYKMWEIISKDLDKQAVASGDRMSYFSAEFPTAASFEMYMRKQLQGLSLNEGEDISAFLEKLAKDLKSKYPELKFIPKIDKINVEGSNQDKADFANATQKTDWGNGFTTFDVDDDDMGYIVRITRVNRL